MYAVYALTELITPLIAENAEREQTLTALVPHILEVFKHCAADDAMASSVLDFCLTKYYVLSYCVLCRILIFIFNHHVEIKVL